MTREIVVETAGERVAHRTHVFVEARVFLLRQLWDLEGTVESIFIQTLFTINFGSSTECVYKVFLDAPKIIFGLRVSKTEHRARIGTAKNVRHAVNIAIDRDGASEWVCNCLCVTEKQTEKHCQYQSAWM